MGGSGAAVCGAGLSAQQMRWLLDYAAQQAGAGIGAWRRDTEHVEKAFLFGAMLALVAAVLMALVAPSSRARGGDTS